MMTVVLYQTKSFYHIVEQDGPRYRESSKGRRVLVAETEDTLYGSPGEACSRPPTSTTLNVIGKHTEVRCRTIRYPHGGRHIQNHRHARIGRGSHKTGATYTPQLANTSNTTRAQKTFSRQGLFTILRKHAWIC